MPREQRRLPQEPVYSTMPTYVAGARVLRRSAVYSNLVHQFVGEGGVWANQAALTSGLIGSPTGPLPLDVGFYLPFDATYLFIAHGTGFRTAVGNAACQWYIDNTFYAQSLLYYNSTSFHGALHVSQFTAGLTAGYHTFQMRASLLSSDANDYFSASWHMVG